MIKARSLGCGRFGSACPAAILVGMSARRLKVLTVIDRAGTSGGAERFALGLASNLPQERFEPWVCSTWEANPQGRTRLEELGIPIVELGRQSRWQVHRFAGLAALLRRERFDVMHTHKFGSNLWGTTLGRACRVPVLIAHEHTWSYQGNRPRVWLDGHVIGRLATCFIAGSAADGERMVTIEGVAPGKVQVMPGTAYLPGRGSPDSEIRAELGLAPGTPLVAVAAVLRPQKALDVLLAAHARVVEHMPAAHLVIAGDGACRPELEQMAQKLGLDGQVHFLGNRTDVDGILRAADVAALSSDFEGSPMFVAECMASGTPLVSTAVGGIPDMLEGGRSGVLVAPRDSSALAEAVIRLLDDPEERRRLASEGSRRLADFTVEAVAARYGELYERLARAAGIG
jgi:glycosyltransferase involved in cell wall biosynthesis